MSIPNRLVRSLARAALFAALSGCAHRAVKKVGDCDQVAAEQRLECGACTVKNEAGGWIGDFEYRPDNDPGERCVRVK